MLSVADCAGSVIDVWMSVGHRWTENDGVQLKHAEKNLFQCHLVHQSHTDWIGTETSVRSDRPASNRLSYGMANTESDNSNKSTN